MKRTKRFTALMLAGLLGMGTLMPAMDAMAAQDWSKVGDTYQVPDGTAINGVKARGIDVSRWQKEIDWNRVAADDVEFVMLGTRTRAGDVDPYFRANVEAAHAAGLKVGVYIYSYATSVAEAEAEADFILDLIKDYPISFPVAFDAEDEGTQGQLPPSQVSALINAFCSKIEAAGYHPMVYANEYWLKNKIDMSAINYDIWVARYNALYTYSNPSMWQATSTGRIDGINGNVDIDFLFKDYTPLIASDTWRTIAGKSYYYKDFQMQKSQWIHDGQGHYYMGDDGVSKKGWTTFSEGRYYLDQTTGKMAQNWVQMDGVWYYFGDTGVMRTGWTDVDGSRYLLDSEGRMKTGWQEESGKQYYLSDSGAMSVGWNELNGSRYYFENSGAMTKEWIKDGDSWYYMGSDGVMRKGWQQVGGRWYHLEESGQMTTGWKQLDGSWYYMEDSGAMLTGWQQLDGSWYYFNEDGQVQRGLIDLGQTRYYLDGRDGRMAANTTVEIDGVTYQADESGALTAAQAQEGDGNVTTPEGTGQTPAQPETPANKPAGPGFQ